MEICITAGIGYQFRARPFNVLSHQMQQIATEIADQMLPRITAVVLKEDMFDAPNLIAWREHSDADPVSSCNHQVLLQPLAAYKLPTCKSSRVV